MKKKTRAGIIIALLFISALIAFLYLLQYNKPTLEVSLTKLDFGTKETVKELTIKNAAQSKWYLILGLKPLNYKIDSIKGSDWISFDPKSGTSEGEINTVNVKIDRSKLTIGDNRGEITISSNGGNKIIEILGIREKDAITITRPTPGSTLTIGKEAPILWEATSGVANTVNISLYLNECMVKNIANDYTYRSNNYSPGKFGWNLEEDLLPGGGGYTLRVEDDQNRELFSEVYPIKISYPLTEIKIENINAVHQKPSTVQYIFSLRDQFNHAVSINLAELDLDNLQIWENKEEIDYLESHAFFHKQDDFQLQVMLVLDFSASMKKHTNGIKTMIEGAKSLIDSLKETHEIGVVEFHRPTKSPSILMPFLTDKNAAKNAIDNFAVEEIYSDFSICWDAVYKGLKQFPTDPNPKVFRSIVFLSDGFDNSSNYKPEQLISLANSLDVHIYIIGVGEVHDETVLENISKETGGTYIHAEYICVLLERLKQVITDLGGQYKISYITPKKPKDGIFNVISQITYKGVTSYPLLEGQIDPSLIYSDTINGIISFTTSHNVDDGKVELFMWCEHAPRYIHEFYFNLGTDYTYSIESTSNDEGGLCENWQITAEENGWFRLTSPNPSDSKYDIEFGDIGTICKIVIQEVSGDKLTIPFNLDNSVYRLGQSFNGGDKSEVNQNGIWSTEINVKLF